MGVPRPWLVVVGMRVDVIALHAGGGVLRSGADLVVFRLVVAALCGGGAVAAGQAVAWGSLGRGLSPSGCGST